MPTPTSYNYKKTITYADQLQSQIRASQIVTAVDHIDTSGNSITIFFKDALSDIDNTTLDGIVAAYQDVTPVQPPVPVVTTGPKDSDGSDLARNKITATGWKYQLHQIEFTTSTINGVYNSDINLNTFAETDLGYASIKLYKSDATLITDQATADASCSISVIDWMVNHDMDIVGGQFYQALAPVVDVRLWLVAAPGIANIKFCQGGINLKHSSNGARIDADGRATKFVSATLPIPGCNRFRTILKHPVGLKHNAMLLFELYKP